MLDSTHNITALRSGIVADHSILKQGQDSKLLEIEKQHVMLATHLNDIIAEFNQVVELHTQNHQLVTLLTRFNDELRDHFKTEEDLMQSFDYSRFNQHHKEHAMFLVELKIFVKEIAQYTTIVEYFDVFKYLKVWFILHISDDEQMVAEYQAKNIRIN